MTELLPLLLTSLVSLASGGFFTWLYTRKEKKAQEAAKSRLTVAEVSKLEVETTSVKVKNLSAVLDGFLPQLSGMQKDLLEAILSEPCQPTRIMLRAEGRLRTICG